MNYLSMVRQGSFIPNNNLQYATILNEQYGIQLTGPSADLSEVPLSPPSSGTPLLGRRRLSIFRRGILSGVIGATGFLSGYCVILGFRNHHFLLVLVGLYGSISSLAEARRLNRASVTILSRYEEGTILNQICILFCHLLTQQCITLFCESNRHPLPIVEADDIL